MRSPVRAPRVKAQGEPLHVPVQIARAPASARGCPPAPGRSSTGRRRARAGRRAPRPRRRSRRAERRRTRPPANPARCPPACRRGPRRGRAPSGHGSSKRSPTSATINAAEPISSRRCARTCGPKRSKNRRSLPSEAGREPSALMPAPRWPRIRCATRSHVCSRSTHARPAAPMRRRRSGSSASIASAAATSAASPGSHRTPVSPSLIELGELAHAARDQRDAGGHPLDRLQR